MEVLQYLCNALLISKEIYNETLGCNILVKESQIYQKLRSLKNVSNFVTFWI